MRRGTRLVVTALLCALTVAACNNPEYSRSSVERDLVRDTDLSPAQAECVARRLEDTVGERRLGARDEPTAGERAYLHSALVFAGVACSGRPFDVAKVQRFLVDKAKANAADARCLVEHAVLDVGAEQLAAGDNLSRATVPKVRGALAWGSLTCVAATGEPAIAAMRANVGVDRGQAQCLVRRIIRGEPALPVGAKPQDHGAVVERCTSVTVPTTTSTTASTTAPAGGSATTSPPSSTPSS